MTDRKLIIHYKVVNPLILGVFNGTPHNKYDSAEMCCDKINSVLGEENMFDVSPRPVDNPKVMLYVYSDMYASRMGMGEIHFCPFCGAEIELKEVTEK